MEKLQREFLWGGMREERKFHLVDRNGLFSISVWGFADLQFDSFQLGCGGFLGRKASLRGDLFIRTGGIMIVSVFPGRLFG